MSTKAAVTVHLPREEVERQWQARSPLRQAGDVAVAFREAPGDRGTEIHVALGRSAPGGRVGRLVAKVTGAVPLATVKDELRRFKQQVETGTITRSDATPEGERLGHKLARPGQPLPDAELPRAGA